MPKKWYKSFSLKEKNLFIFAVGERMYCPIRGKWLSDQPEERVRLALIDKMINELGYPKSLLVVEKGIDRLPHLQNRHHQSQLGDGPLPNRRIDILCFRLDDSHLKPLLLVECKAKEWSQKAVLQLLGYNRLIQAPFLSLATVDWVKTISYKEAHLSDLCAGIPSYASLLTLL